MAVRGMPQPPIKPEPPEMDENAGFWRRRHYKKEAEVYEEAMSAYEANVAKYAAELHSFKISAEYQLERTNKIREKADKPLFEGNPELIRACNVRKHAESGGWGYAKNIPANKKYTNPHTYIRDLWASDYISDDDAARLLDEIKHHDGVAGPLTTAFLEAEAERGYILPEELKVMRCYGPEHGAIPDVIAERHAILTAARAENPQSLAAQVLAQKELNKGIYTEREVERAVEREQAEEQQSQVSRGA